MLRVFFAALFLMSFQATAQDDLFSIEKPPARKGLIFGVNGGLDFPGGDMADRFGMSYRAGVQVVYKTKSNWIFGPKFDYMFGNKLREDSLLVNVVDKYGTYINNEGRRISILVFERGYMIGMQGGKIFNIGKQNSDNGILALTTVGFMEHKILLRERENSLPQLRGDYVKGYDRLTNGLLLEQYVGYMYLSNNNMVNFHIGLNLSAGFTQGRRDFLYDVGRPDNASRVDLLFGIRAGWYIPVFKKKSEEYFFE